MYILGLFMGAFIGIFLMCMVQINREKESCLHCGNGEGVYCETCYQNLISENAKLQYKNTKLQQEINVYKKARQEFENEIKKENIELRNKYVNHIPHVD